MKFLFFPEPRVIKVRVERRKRPIDEKAKRIIASGDLWLAVSQADNKAVIIGAVLDFMC